MVDSSIDELIVKCKQGDRKAIEELIKQNCKLVTGIAYNILGDLNSAYEVAQETFLKIINHISEISSSAKFKGWLFVVTRSTCIDWIRRNKHRPKSLENMTSNYGDFIQSRESEINSFEQEEIFEKILKIINSLPKIYRDVILLRQLRDMNYKEIAEQLDISESTVDSRLYRARLMLREKLKNLLEGV